MFNELISENSFIRIVKNDPSAMYAIFEEACFFRIKQNGKLYDCRPKKENFNKLLVIAEKSIASRERPEDRVLRSECYNIDGEYSEKMKERILWIRKKTSPIIKKNVNKTNIKKLCEETKIPEFMGELFLNELKLSYDKENGILRYRAQSLGLL